LFDQGFEQFEQQRQKYFLFTFLEYFPRQIFFCQMLIPTLRIEAMEIKNKTQFLSSNFVGNSRTSGA